jgi:hypothetical protein
MAENVSFVWKGYTLLPGILCCVFAGVLSDDPYGCGSGRVVEFLADLLHCHIAVGRQMQYFLCRTVSDIVGTQPTVGPHGLGYFREESLYSIDAHGFLTPDVRRGNVAKYG